MSMNTTGRIKAAVTINRELRRTLNAYTQVLAEKTLAKALGGDSTAMFAANEMRGAADV